MGLLQNLGLIYSIFCQVRMRRISMTKHTASRGCLLPPVFCTVALQAARIDPFGACLPMCHAQLLAHWGREVGVIQHHGDLEGVNFTQIPLCCSIPGRKRRLRCIFPQKKKSICVRRQGMCVSVDCTCYWYCYMKLTFLPL